MRSARLLPICLAAATLLVSAVTHYRWTREQRQIAATFDRVEFVDEFRSARISVAKANDVSTLRSRAIRGLLASQLAFPDIEDLSTEQRTELRDKSNLVVEELLALSRSTWQKEPGSWVAAMGLGAGEFLAGLRSKEGLERLPREQWFAPLTQAQVLAPSRGEVEGYLALALLETWSDLSKQDRTQATVSLRQALETPRFRAVILPRWMRIQHDYDEMVSILPESVSVWQSVQRSFENDRQWKRAVRAKTKLRQLRLIESQNTLQRGKRLIDGGEIYKGSGQLGLALASVVPENGSVAQMVEVTRTLPPGPVHRSLAREFRPWLRWANRQCVLSICPIADDVLNRLAGIVEDDRVEADIAHAIVTREPAEPALSDEDWGLHWIALLQVSRDDLGTATLYASQVDGKWRRSAAFVDAVRNAGIAQPSLPRNWSPTDWIWSGPRAYLSIVLTEATTLEVNLHSSNRGGVATLWLDGDWKGYPVVEGSSQLSFDLEAGNHVLEFKPDHRGEVTTGSARVAGSST